MEFAWMFNFSGAPAVKQPQLSHTDSESGKIYICGYLQKKLHVNLPHFIGNAHSKFVKFSLQDYRFALRSFSTLFGTSLFIHSFFISEILLYILELQTAKTNIETKYIAAYFGRKNKAKKQKSKK